MKLIIVSSLETHCRDAAVAQLLARNPGALSISHDLLEGNRLLRRVAGNLVAAERAESVLEHLCIGCAVKFEILPTLLRLLPARGDAVVIQALPATWHSDQVIDGLRAGLEERGVQVDSVVLALDPAAVQDQFWDRRTLWESGFNAMEQDERAAGEFLMRELALADTVHCVEGLSATLLGEAAALVRAGGEEFLEGRHLLRHIAPHAVQLAPGAGGLLGRHDPQEALRRVRPGFLPQPHPQAVGATIRVMVDRPLDPQRFQTVLPQVAESCTCLRGTLWMANCPGVRVALSGAGCRVWLESTGSWDSEVACTQLEFAGSEHEAEEVIQLLKSCELSDEELAGLRVPQREGATPHDAAEAWEWGENA